MRERERDFSIIGVTCRNIVDNICHCLGFFFQNYNYFFVIKNKISLYLIKKIINRLRDV